MLFGVISLIIIASTHTSFMAGISLQVVMALHVFSPIFATSILVVMPFSISLLASAAGQPEMDTLILLLYLVYIVDFYVNIQT